MGYTADDLISSVKRTIAMPDYQSLLTDSDLLAFANEEVETMVIPLITSLREDFFVTSTDLAIVADQNEYDIPYRAIGRTIREIKYKFDSSNNDVRNLALVPIEDAHLYVVAGDPRGFFFKGDKIRVVPTPASATGFLEVWYELRPSALVQTTDAGQVTSIDTDTNTVVLNRAPTDVSNGSLVDFIEDKSGNEILAFDQTVSNISGTTLTFSSLPTGLAVNDWVSLAETSPVVQLPREVFQYLAQAVSCRALEAVGDTEGQSVAKKRLDEKERNLKQTLAPRVEGEQKKIINRYGLLRGRNSYYNFRRRYT